MTEKTCQNGCGTLLTWDALKAPPPNSTRAKENKIGWWIESLTKRDHSCPKYKKTQETQQTIKTVWANAELDEKGEEILEGLKAFKNIAYHLAKEEHPEMSDQDNLFGQIVNANTTHLVQLALIKAIKTKETQI